MSDCRSNLDKNHHLFCFFKGSTKGLFEVGESEKIAEKGLYHIHLPSVFLKKELMVVMGDYIQLDGVLCQVIEAEHEVTADHNQYKWDIVASTTVELVEGTTLKDVAKGSNVSLGLMAIREEEAQFFIHPSVSKQARCIKIEETVGSRDQPVVRFDFSCAAGDISQDHHVGLAGSAFYIKSAEENQGVINFTIFAGKESQANTRFNKEALKVGELVNVNVAKNDSTSEAVYPNKHLSLSKA